MGFHAVPLKGDKKNLSTETAQLVLGNGSSGAGGLGRGRSGQSERGVLWKSKTALACGVGIPLAVIGSAHTSEAAPNEDPSESHDRTDRIASKHELDTRGDNVTYAQGRRPPRQAHTTTGVEDGNFKIISITEGVQVADTAPTAIGADLIETYSKLGPNDLHFNKFEGKVRGKKHTNTDGNRVVVLEAGPADWVTQTFLDREIRSRTIITSTGGSLLSQTDVIDKKERNFFEPDVFERSRIVSTQEQITSATEYGYDSFGRYDDKEVFLTVTENLATGKVRADQEVYQWQPTNTENVAAAESWSDPKLYPLERSGPGQRYVRLESSPYGFDLSSVRPELLVGIHNRPPSVHLHEYLVAQKALHDGL